MVIIVTTFWFIRKNVFMELLIYIHLRFFWFIYIVFYIGRDASFSLNSPQILYNITYDYFEK